MNESFYSVGKTCISITTLADTISKIEEVVAAKKNNIYICVSNPRTIVYANKNQDYLNVMKNSFMNLPDAEPTVWAARLWGLKSVKRTMGPYLLKEMLANPQNGIKHFLLGDTQETLDKLVIKFKQEYNSNIVGSYSPPFCSLEEYDYTKIGEQINKSNADIVWLALRAPKQDFFSVKLLPYLRNKICIGVGAAFRFNLGEYKLAPPLIKKMGLMGLYWGKKNQKIFPFLYGYLSENVPYLFLIAAIPLKRLLGKKHYM